MNPHGAARPGRRHGLAPLARAVPLAVALLLAGPFATGAEPADKAPSAAKPAAPAKGSTTASVPAKAPAKPATSAKAATPAKAPAATKAAASAKRATKGKGKAVARAPAPPQAALKPAIATNLQLGCLPGDDASLLAQWGIPVNAMAALTPTLEAHVASGCLRYAAALGSEAQASSLAAWGGAGSTEGPAFTLYSRPPGEAAARAMPLDAVFAAAARREVTIPAQDLGSLPPETLETVPEHLHWMLGILVRQLEAGWTLTPAHRLRLVLDGSEDSEQERLVALELLDADSGFALESIVWLDRPTGLGAFFSTSGADYERPFWISPVKEVRISRGIGRSSMAIKRRVAVKVPNQSKPKMVMRTFRSRAHHIGVDFAAPKGTPVHAVADAEVAFVGSKGGYGNLVILDHGAEHQTYYAHLSAFATDLKAGQRVLRGEEIGLVGSTGFSTGPHLHFELRKDGLYIDPMDPAKRLESWSLQPEEHGQLLSRLLVLDITRARAPREALYLQAALPMPSAVAPAALPPLAEAPEVGSAVPVPAKIAPTAIAATSDETPDASAQ